MALVPQSDECSYCLKLMSQLLGHFGVRRLSMVETTQGSGLKHHIFGEISCPCSQSQGDPGDLDLAGTSAGHELVSK